MQPVSRGLAYSEPQLRLTQMDNQQLSSPEWNSGWEGLTMTDISGDRPSIVASASRFRLKSARSANSTMAGGRNSHSSFTEECRQETSVLAPRHISLGWKDDQTYLVPHHFYIYLTDPASGKTRRIVPTLLTAYGDASGVIGQVNHYVNTDGTALEEGITPSEEEDLSIYPAADEERFRNLVTDGKTREYLEMWADNLPDWASRQREVWEEDGWSVWIQGMEAADEGCGAETPSDGGDADEAGYQLDDKQNVTSAIGIVRSESKRVDSMFFGSGDRSITYGHPPRPRTTSVVSESDAEMVIPDGADESAAFRRTWSGNSKVAMQ